MSPTTLARPAETRETHLSIEAIRRRLDNEVVGHHIYLFGLVTSTNAVLRRCADAGAREGTVVLAEEQERDGGPRGEAVFSPPGVNLYASVLFRPELPPEAGPVFARIAALALTDAIWAEGLPAAIREPNDVLVDGRKVAATLVDASINAGGAAWVILGIAANVNVTRQALREGLHRAAAAVTSLREAAGHEIDRNAFAAAFLGFLEKWVETYRARGPAAVTAAWRSRLAPPA